MANLVVGLIACGGSAQVSTTEPADPTRSSEQDIQGGTVDMGDPAVGMLSLADGGLCTGSLLAPDVVLTAAHCAKIGATAFWVGSGTTDAQGKHDAVVYWVKESIVHPTFNGVVACPNLAPDVALVRLKKPVLGVVPLNVSRGPLPQPNAILGLIGFGAHSDGSGRKEFGIKRRATASMLGRSGVSSIAVGRLTGISDSGDSGGPALSGDEIIAVASCHYGTWPYYHSSYYARVDNLGTWIDSVLASWASPG